MINDNIKKYRKEKGLSQEEMAVKLRVVRQTVSKWEKGLSVPDAEVLIKMSELLEVSVGQLLGTEIKSDNEVALTDELVRLNELLANKNQKENLLVLANKKRGLILFLAFAAMLISLIVKNEIISIVAVGACLLCAVAVLYRNLALLTSISTDDLRIGTLRVTTVFNGVVLIIGIIASVLVGLDVIVLSEVGEKIFAMLLVSCVMLVIGIISPRLPFSKHTGLRLPWTVQDEESWNIAHKIIGYISLPLVLLYVAGTWTLPNFEIVTLAIILAWIGIPSIISFLYFEKKMHGKV